MASSFRTLRIPRTLISLRKETERLHLDAKTAGEYVQSYVPNSTLAPPSASSSASKPPPSTSTPTTYYRLSASRSHHAPIIQALSLSSASAPAPSSAPPAAAARYTPTGPPLVLDIQSSSLPANTGEWLWRLGRGAEMKHALEGVWAAWKEGGLTRLELGIRPGQAGGQGGQGGQPGEGEGGEGQVVLSDVQAQVDDFALSSHPRWSALTDQLAADDPTLHPLEQKARASGLFYHKRPLSTSQPQEGEQGARRGGGTGARGGIGTYGYGAGNAMATMDALIREGGEPTNFLDGGGGATESNVQAALDLLFTDPDVRVIFVNSFGGLTKTELIAEGLIAFLRKRKAKGETWPPIVVRLRGTGEKEAADILSKADDLPGIIVQPDLRAAAQAAVHAWQSLDM